MNKAAAITISISISALLALGVTGCAPSGNSGNASPSSSTSVPPELPRQSKGYLASYEKALDLKDAKEFTANNFLAVSETSRFTIKAYGTVETNQSGMHPAAGEVFHSVHYTYVKTEPGENRPQPTVTINGETKPFTSILFDQGTLMVSAPADAEVLFGLNFDGVTQNIELKTAERKSLGVSDTWYADQNGKVENGNVSMEVPVGGITPTLSYTVIEAKRLPYLEEESLGWAEKGKNTWVVLDMSPVAWKLAGFDQLKGKSKATLVDDEGNKYTSTFLSEGNTTDNNKLAFSVPTDKTSFIVLTETSADFSSWGKSAGKAEGIPNDQTKITFEAIKK